MNNKIPTVDDLVKIFKDNNWTPKRTDGADLHNILNGKCCAIPAVIKFIYPDYDFNKTKRGQDIYNIVNKTYGDKECDSLYSGFDGISCDLVNEEFYNLGKELYEKLTEVID